MHRIPAWCSVTLGNCDGDLLGAPPLAAPRAPASQQGRDPFPRAAGISSLRAAHVLRAESVCRVGDRFRLRSGLRAHDCNGDLAFDNTLSANARAKTRCHELGHALIRRERQEGDPELDRAAEELVVESIAYTTVGALGISSEVYSIPYLASWAEQTDLQVLEQLAELIDRHTTRIENAVL